MVAAQPERIARKVPGTGREQGHERRPASLRQGDHQNTPLQVPAQATRSQANATGGGSLGRVLACE